jgi:hypothetical protein
MNSPTMDAAEKPVLSASRYQSPLTVLLLLVVALGLFVRFWRFGDWPPLYGDEAVPGVMAMRALEGGLSELAGTRVYFGNLFPLAKMVPIALLGNTTLALRSTILIGIPLSLLMVFLTARRLLGPSVALIALAVAAILPLAVVHEARMPLEPSFAFVITSIALYFGVVAFQRKSVLAAVASGLFLALDTQVYPAASLAIPAMVAGLVFSGRLRGHVREAVVVLLIAGLFSFPSTRIVAGLLTRDDGPDVVAAWRYGSRMGTEDTRWSSPFSVSLTAENFARCLDQWTGAIAAETLLGTPVPPWSKLTKALRGVCVLLWLLMLLVVWRSGSKGRFVVAYLMTVSALAHLANPAFMNLPEKGRYIVASFPMIPLLVGLAVTTAKGKLTRPVRGAVMLMFAMWIGIAVIMLSFIARGVTGNFLMMTTTVGDPNKAATQFLMEHVKPTEDLVLCRSWWSYWPIAYFSAEQFSMFTSGLVDAENEAVVFPKPDQYRRVWWVQLPYADTPPFDAQLLTQWADRANPDRYYSIWLAEDPATAVQWAVEDYQFRLLRKSRRFKVMQ